jgi:hypothetical protein
LAVLIEAMAMATTRQFHQPSPPAPAVGEGCPPSRSAGGPSLFTENGFGPAGQFQLRGE